MHTKIPKQQMYASVSLSMTSKGHRLHVASMEKKCTKSGASNIRRDTEDSGISIPFSCTWKLAKKNASDVDAVPQSNSLISLPSFGCLLSPLPTLNSIQHGGRINSKVSPNAASGSKFSGIRLLIENGLIDNAHQMLATLPSNSPR